MWVRSQDKDIIVNANEFHVYEYKATNVWFIETNNTILGKFKLEKQARKVMDAIHQHIEMHPTKVYQMPKDSTII